jgi:FSR family fosmidomycin resistance protein-like MFS transporter
MFNLKVLILLSIGHLVVDIYQGALPAVLPFLKERLSLSYTMAGLILMVSNFTSSILQPLFGFYSDKRHMRALLPIGLFCAGIGFAIITIQKDYHMVLLFVTLSGLGIAAYHPEGYKTAHFFTGKKSATGMSIFSVGGNIGLSLGPIIAIYIIKYMGFSSLPVIVIPALLCACAVIYYRKTLTIKEAENTGIKRIPPSRAPMAAYIYLSLVIGVVIMRSWTQMGIITYIPFYYIDYLKGDPLFAGKLVFTFLLCGAAGTLIGAPFADKWGHKRFLVATQLLSSLLLPLIFLPFIQKGGLIFIVLGLHGMVLISTFSVTVVIAQKLLPNKLGIASGLTVGFAIGTGGVGVTLLGIIADHFGVPAALKSLSILPVLALMMSLMINDKD